MKFGYEACALQKSMGSYLRLQDKIDWRDPPHPLSLTEDAVHVWYGALQSGFNDSAYTGLLSLQEQNRARRFRFALDRKRFIARHAILRIILYRYSNIASNDIGIEWDRHGKPGIRPDIKRVVFSLSHSGDSVIYAIARNRGLGIDMEYIKEISARPILAVLFSSTAANKIKSYQSLDNTHFYGLWTSLEAYLKAIGTGFGRPLDDEFWANFPIEMGTGESNDPDWSVFHFLPQRSFFSTLIVKAPEIQIKFFNLPNLVGSESEQPWLTPKAR